MDLECISPSEISQAEKRQILYEVTYVESKKKLTSEYNKKETGSQI